MSDVNQTKTRIKDTLLELMMTTDADKISAAELARSAHVARATFYRYYDSVDAVLCEITEEFLEGMRDRHRYYISTPIDLDDLGTPQPVFVAFASYLWENRKVFLAMTGAHGDVRFTHKWHELFKEYNYGKFVYDGLARDNMDIYMEFMLAGVDAMLRYWFEKRPEMSPERDSHIMQRMLYGPFVCS